MLRQPQNRRGAIGIRTGRTWQATYNFADSTPLVLGPQIWKMLQENWKSLERWGNQVLKYDYWDRYINDGICPYCGKTDVGKATRINGQLALQVAQGELAPDPEAKRHVHKPHKPAMTFSENEEIEGLWVEWVYIVNPKDYMLEVLRSVREKGTFPVVQGMRSWQQPYYRYHSIGLFSLFGDEPDWERVQKSGLSASAYYYNKYNSQSSRKKVL
jgi:hypothetical protein